MELQHVIGMGGEHARALTWCPSGREVVYVCNHSLVAQDTQTGVQRFFLGHTADVVAVAFSGDGQVSCRRATNTTRLFACMCLHGVGNLFNKRINAPCQEFWEGTPCVRRWELRGWERSYVPRLVHETTHCPEHGTI